MAIPLSYNLRNLRVRYTTTIMTALGIGLTVAVLLGILALLLSMPVAYRLRGGRGTGRAFGMAAVFGFVLVVQFAL